MTRDRTEDIERVLIIDDDPAVGTLIKTQVGATGREARLTDDPEEFLSIHANGTRRT